MLMNFDLCGPIYSQTIDRRLSVEQTSNINRPSWCRDHGPDVDPTIFTDFSQPYTLRMVCRRSLPIAIGLIRN